MAPHRSTTVADHVVPHRGDPTLFWEGELQGLCDSHHSGAKQAAEKSGRTRGSDADGFSLDPSDPWYGGRFRAEGEVGIKSLASDPRRPGAPSGNAKWQRKRFAG